MSQAGEGKKQSGELGFQKQTGLCVGKQYFIGVAYVYKSGLTLGKEVCPLLSMNAGDTCIFCVFLSGFPLLRKQNSGDNGMS